MKKLFLVLLFPFLSFSQSIQVDDNYPPQELIEQVLVNSPCIQNVTVTEAAGGNFTDQSRSFGYFDASGTSFPIKKGLVLSTGKLGSITRPTSVLSDDDAPGWAGDADLDSEFNVKTYNATILEFDFVPAVSQLSFRYLFASEEYQARSANTCRFSDVFAFFIRPAGNSAYQNIALVPNTNTPVSVTTVHPDITQGCEAINESYFDRFNTNAPTVFDGQTTVLTASANVTAAQTYHVKLVIADDENYRFDSAVFLEAGSFQPNINLGSDLLVSKRSALCVGESITLNAGDSANKSFKWFKDDQLLPGETGNELVVGEEGNYRVEVSSGNGCGGRGEIKIEYYPEIQVNTAQLYSCSFSDDENATYNLLESDAQILGNTDHGVEGYYLTAEDALSGTNPIQDPEHYVSEPGMVYASVHDGNGCVKSAKIVLNASGGNIDFETLKLCDDFPLDGKASISLDEMKVNLLEQLPDDASIDIFGTEQDALQNTNALNGTYQTAENSDELFLRISKNGNCYGLTILKIAISEGIQLGDHEKRYACPGNPVISISSGIISSNTGEFTYTWFLNGNLLEDTSETITTSEFGNYRVEVVNKNGCSGSREIEVVPSEIPQINDVQIESENQLYRVEVSVSGSGNFKYALDSTNDFRNEPVFSGVRPGIHTIYVQDKNACGTVSREISIFGYDHYFTPNGDGIHDNWNMYGISGDYKILIFDRYGKLIQQLNRGNSTWNGKFNGSALPSDDYWFKLILGDEIITGHFSLIR